MSKKSIRWARKDEVERRCTRCRHAEVDGVPGARLAMYCMRHDQETGAIYTCPDFEQQESDGRVA